MSLIVGLAFLLVNFPRFLTETIGANVPPGPFSDALIALVASSQRFMSSLMSRDPAGSLTAIMTRCFQLLWLLGAAVLLLGTVRFDIGRPIAALAGTALGYAALHLASWPAVAAVSVIGGTLFVVRWALGIVAAITAFIMSVAAAVFAFIFAFVSAHIWATGVLCVLLLAYAFRRYWAQILATALGLTAVAYTMYIVLPPLWRWIVNLLTPLLEAVTEAVRWLWSSLGPIVQLIVYLLTLLVIAGAAALILTFALASMGSLVIEQLRAGWHAGRGRKSLMLAGFAVGSAISLVLLQAAANPGLSHSINVALASSFEISARAFEGLQPVVYAEAVDDTLTDLFLQSLPSTVQVFTLKYLTHAPAPVLDALVLALALLLANVSVIFGILSFGAVDSDEATVHFYPKEYFELVGGLLVSVLLVFLQAESEG